MCAVMRIYCIAFDCIRKETDLGEVLVYYDFDTWAVLSVPEERTREFIEYRTGKEKGFRVRKFPPDSGVVA